MTLKTITLRLPIEDAERIAQKAADRRMSVNAFLHQAAMAAVNEDAVRFAAPTREFLDFLNADPEARAMFDELDQKIDPKPRRPRG